MLRPLPALALGALVYVIALTVMFRAGPQDMSLFGITPLAYLTPFFGLAYVVTRRLGVLDILYFLIALPLVHEVAIRLASRVPGWIAGRDSGAELLLAAGAVGGAVGAMLSFALLAAIRESARSRTARRAAISGTVALAALGAIGVFVMFSDWARDFGYVLLYLPWQLTFAYFLTRMIGREAPASSL